MSMAIKGYSSEYEVIADLIRQGFIPSIPALPDSVYDVIAEKDNKLYKIQIKSSEFNGDKISVHTRKSNGTAKERRYTTNEIDIIAIHDRISKGTAYVRNQERTKITLYKDTPVSINGRRKNDKIHIFDDYLIISGQSERIACIKGRSPVRSSA